MGSLEGEKPYTDVSKRWHLAHIAWIAMFLSMLMWNIGSIKGGEIGNYGNWYRISLTVFAGIVGIRLLLAYPKGLFLAPPLLLLFSYGVGAFLTSLLVPSDAFYAMFKASEIIIDVLIITAFVGYARNAALAYNTIYFLYFIVLTVILLQALVMPSVVLIPSRGMIPFQIRGVYPAYSANGVGFLSAVCLFVAIVRAAETTLSWRRIGYGLIAILSSVSFLFAQARTAIIALSAAFLVYLIVSKRYITLIVLLPIAISAIVYTGGGEYVVKYFVRGVDDDLLLSLSGRTTGWRASWESFKESPIIGHGFAAAARREILGVAGASTLHGSVFDVMVGVGLVGLITWGGALIIGAFRLFSIRSNAIECLGKEVSHPSYAEVFGVATIVFVRSLTSSGLAMHDHTFMLALSILAVLYSVSPKQRGLREVSPRSWTAMKKV